MRYNYRYVRSYSLSERALSLLCVCGWREEYERASLSLSFRGGLFSLRAYANSPVGMAPLFEAAGFAPFFQCKFRLKAFDDGKLRCYADTATGTVEVVARFHGLTMEQFNSLFSCIKQLQKSENHSSNTAVSLAAFQSAFDGCFEQALGRTWVGSKRNSAVFGANARNDVNIANFWAVSNARNPLVCAKNGRLHATVRADLPLTTLFAESARGGLQLLKLQVRQTRTKTKITN